MLRNNSLPCPALRPVYVTAAGAFLPGERIGNDEMEASLGLVDGQPSKFRSRILRSNGIEGRHYALDKDGNQTHLNQDLAALAIEDALRRRGLTARDISLLAVGTTIPDLLMPGFAPMVHGRLGGGPMETLSASGICASSTAALKAAWLAVASGDHEVAVAAGSELASAMMKSSRFERESHADEREGQISSYTYFNADFLRWMLSDGAGAFVLEPAPAPHGYSLRIEWIKLTSYAHSLDTCMYMGSSNPARPAPGNTWLSQANATDAEQAGMMVVRQDTKLLAAGMGETVAREAKRLFDNGLLDPAQVDHFVPHVSSYFFYEALGGIMQKAGVPIAPEKWFTNLKTKGNTGSASIYIAMEEALNEGRFKPGDRVLTMVPESGRFSVSFALYTCVGPA
jgi:3-oxoacyl-[acyl-carrier-protein] synthase-3